MSKRIGKNAWRKQAAMERQLGAALRAMVDSPADDVTMMQWHPPKEPIDRIVKLLLSLSDCQQLSLKGRQPVPQPGNPGRKR